VGRRAPDFSLAALQNGTPLPTPISLDGLRGQTVLLVFVNSLCVHCGGTVQAANALAASGADARVLLVDSPAEATTIAEGYALRLGIEAPILQDAGGTVSATYGITGYPATFLVDGAGVVRNAWTGEVGGSAMAKALGALSVK
jgi:cytochrome c biogenesis protein CcmG/thiol:disulfide interchange protein DsbE